MSTGLDLRFSGRRAQTKSERRAGVRPRQRIAEMAMVTKARTGARPEFPGIRRKVPKVLPAPPRRVVIETPAQREANNQLASRHGGVIRIDTHNIQYRLHVEQSTSTALLRRHYKGTPRGMREAQS